MNNNIWYYEYCIKIFDEEAREAVLRSGVVPAGSMIEAINLLEEYYGEEEIEAIHYLSAILEGAVFEFELINDDSTNDIMVKSSLSRGNK